MMTTLFTLPPLMILVLLCSFIGLSYAANSALAIDLGGSLALVTPNTMTSETQLMLKKKSIQTFPLALSIHKKAHFFSKSAMRMRIKYPNNTYTFFMDLVGKPFDHPVVTAYRAQFPHLKLEADERRGTVNFVTDNGTLPVETMLAMVLRNAFDLMEAFASDGVPIKDVILAVPVFFDAVERKAVETAAEIAGMNLLQLITGGSAAALNYGMNRRSEITETPLTLLIYDVGASNVVATLVQYQLVKEKDVEDPVPVVQTIGFGFNRTLGGHEITLRLRDHLVAEFQKKHRTTRNVTDDPQAMAKLLKEAERVKQVLSEDSEDEDESEDESRNASHFALVQVKNVTEGQDFLVNVTRDELEAMFADLEPHFLEPVKDALKMANLSIESVDQIELMGGGTRVPRLQQVLSDFVKGKELGRLMDEAIALGAVYRAAYFSKVVEVERFDVREPPLSSNTDQDSEKLKQRLMNTDEVAAAKKILSDLSAVEGEDEWDAAYKALESAIRDYMTIISTQLTTKLLEELGGMKGVDKVWLKLSQLKQWLENGPLYAATADELKTKKRELDGVAHKLKPRPNQEEGVHAASSSYGFTAGILAAGIVVVALALTTRRRRQLGRRARQGGGSGGGRTAERVTLRNSEGTPPADAGLTE